MNGKQFHDALKMMDDEAYITADINVENSPAVESVVNNRKTKHKFRSRDR